jgi:hypothetical protein
LTVSSISRMCLSEISSRGSIESVSGEDRKASTCRCEQSNRRKALLTPSQLNGAGIQHNSVMFVMCVM